MLIVENLAVLEGGMVNRPRKNQAEEERNMTNARNVREELKDERERLLSHISLQDALGRESLSYGSDAADKATATLERARSAAVRRNSEHILAQVDVALNRCEEGPMERVRAVADGSIPHGYGSSPMRHCASSASAVLKDRRNGILDVWQLRSVG